MTPDSQRMTEEEWLVAIDEALDGEPGRWQRAIEAADLWPRDNELPEKANNKKPTCNLAPLVALLSRYLPPFAHELVADLFRRHTLQLVPGGNKKRPVWCPMTRHAEQIMAADEEYREEEARLPAFSGPGSKQRKKDRNNKLQERIAKDYGVTDEQFGDQIENRTNAARKRRREWNKWCARAGGR